MRRREGNETKFVEKKNYFQKRMEQKEPFVLVCCFNDRWKERHELINKIEKNKFSVFRNPVGFCSFRFPHLFSNESAQNKNRSLFFLRKPKWFFFSLPIPERTRATAADRNESAENHDPIAVHRCVLVATLRLASSRLKTRWRTRKKKQKMRQEGDKTDRRRNKRRTVWNRLLFIGVCVLIVALWTETKDETTKSWSKGAQDETRRGRPDLTRCLFCWDTRSATEGSANTACENYFLLISIFAVQFGVWRTRHEIRWAATVLQAKRSRYRSSLTTCVHDRCLLICAGFLARKRLLHRENRIFKEELRL